VFSKGLDPPLPVPRLAEVAFEVLGLFWAQSTQPDSLNRGKTVHGLADSRGQIVTQPIVAPEEDAEVLKVTSVRRECRRRFGVGRPDVAKEDPDGHFLSLFPIGLLSRLSSRPSAPTGHAELRERGCQTATSRAAGRAVSPENVGETGAYPASQTRG
jgi:hypothetical protein